MDENMNNDNNEEIQPTRDPDISQESVGEIIRKTRITKRISIETLAKDLKLNIKYIKALEAENFEELPADAYARVYIRSIAEYLMLDPDMIIKKYYEKKGDTYEQIDETSSFGADDIKTGNAGPTFLYFGIAVLIIVIILLGIFFGRDSIANFVGPEDSTTEVVDTVDTLAGTERDSTTADTAGVLKNKGQKETDTVKTGTAKETPAAKTPVPETEKKRDAETSKPKAKGLELKVKAARESSWVQVYSDGEEWKNILYKGQSKTFRAQDSINIRVGRNAVMHYTLNGDRISPVSKAGVAVFKINPSGDISVWSLSRWKRTFGE